MKKVGYHRFKESFVRYEGFKLYFVVEDCKNEFEDEIVLIDCNDFEKDFPIEKVGEIFVTNVVESKSNKENETTYTIETNIGDIYFYSSCIIDMYKNQ